MPKAPAICPWELLKAYVALTAPFCAVGTAVLRAATPPFAALCANRLGILTKGFLKDLGVNVARWKAHSTRGAGVSMYKNLGFSSEVVCEIGKWKNPTAFAAHYLRLGAARQVGRAVGALVHTVSPMEEAEHDLKRTPGTVGVDPGGIVGECEALNMGETRPAHPEEKLGGTASSADLE